MKNLKGKNNIIDILEFNLAGDVILVSAIKVDGVNGLVNPDQYDDKQEYGEVIMVGDKTSGVVKKGMKVLFGKYSTTSIRSNGKEYLLVREEDILGYKN